MKKVILSLLLSFLFLLTRYSNSLAIVNPLDSPNNKFGIHIIDENDLEDAAKLVNSNGGEWGYITIVITENDRGLEKWQRIFNRMREFKLIPLVRVATRIENEVWIKPKLEDIDNWVNFFDSLNWATKNRYVILFNEPNHAKEWGNNINSAEYAIVAKSFSEKLKQASSDFFILPAGFDSTARNTPETTEVTSFWKNMYETDENIFKTFDGWTSHSYPNPGFSGSSKDNGRGTIKSFEWEILYLSRFGLSQDLPIFITETGWVKNSHYTDDEVSQNFEKAFKENWIDERIVAITPFVLSYIGKPFADFSWKRPDSNEFYPQYQAVQNIPKTKGDPEQDHNSLFILKSLPVELVRDSEYELHILFKNTGQSIWDSEDGFFLKVAGDIPKDDMFVGRVPQTLPGEVASIKLILRTPKETGDKNIILEMEKGGKSFGSAVSREISIIPPPALIMKANLWPKRQDSANDFSLALFEGNQQVLEIKDLLIKNGIGQIPELKDVIPNKTYKFILRKPYFLPSEREVFLSKSLTTIDFGRLFPIDFNNDKIFNFLDLAKAARFPFKAVAAFWPF